LPAEPPEAGSELAVPLRPLPVLAETALLALVGVLGLGGGAACLGAATTTVAAAAAPDMEVADAPVVLGPDTPAPAPPRAPPGSNTCPALPPLLTPLAAVNAAGAPVAVWGLELAYASWKS
jgi:hypothetical protein